MRAIVYSRPGDPDVLRLVERPVPEPGPGEVRVRVAVSAVNPSDWKTRRRPFPGTEGREVERVPNQDGAGVVDAIGPGVERPLGQRVWIYEAAWRRTQGTAQEFVVLPEAQAVPLPDNAPLALGAFLGVPAQTAHRCLTVSDGGPDRLSPGALRGRVVLVAGGAGAVGNAAIQLARWGGAQVVTTVSNPWKAELATLAGADHIVNYHAPDALDLIRAAAPDGVDLVVEVAPAPNMELNRAVLAENSTIAAYAATDDDQLVLPLRYAVQANLRLQFVQIYAIPGTPKRNGVSDVTGTVAAGALRVGDAVGLPLHWFPLEHTADAHAAVEGNAVGKVLIEVDPELAHT